MRTTSMAVACAIVFVAASSPCLASTPAEAINKLAWENLSDAGSKAMTDVLVKANATKEIEAFVMSDARIRKNTTGSELYSLVAALQQMGTPEAVTTLRKLTFRSKFLLDDVKDWDVLARELRAGAREGGNSMARFVWPRLSKGVQAAIARPGTELSTRQKSGIVRSLNRALASRDLYKSFAGQVGQLSEEARMIYKFHDETYEPKLGQEPVERIELERLNRLLIEVSFGGAFVPLDLIPFKYRNTVIANAAFRALSRMKAGSAKQIMLVEKPMKFDGKIAHLSSVMKNEEADASVMLAEYLFESDSALVNRSRDELLKRAKDDARGVAQSTYEAFVMAEYDTIRPLNAKALAAVATKLPEDEGLRIVTRALESENKGLVDATLAAIPQNRNICASADVVSALGELAEEDEIGEGRALAILMVLGTGRSVEGSPIATRFLSHKSPAVVKQAMYALRAITGKALYQVSEWNELMEKDPDALYERAYAEEDEPAATTEAVGDTRSDVERSWWVYAFIGVFVLLLLGLFVTRRKAAQ